MEEAQAAREERVSVAPAGEETGAPGTRSARRQGFSREEMGALMLRGCGERGYRGVRLADLGEGEGQRPAHGWFEDEAECFANGYASEAERLRRLTARAFLEDSPREALEGVLAELSRLVGERPAVARSLLVEVHVAGGRALEERARLRGDLAQAIDEAYRAEGAPPPPADAAAFMVDVIETAALHASVAEDAALLRVAIPDLASMLEELYGRTGAG